MDTAEMVEVKNREPMKMFFVQGPKDAYSSSPSPHSRMV